MSNNTTFHKGQRVTRTGDSYPECLMYKGNIHTVTEYQDGTVWLDGVVGSWDADKFEAVVDKTQTNTVEIFTKGEGGALVLMANKDKETGKVLQVILARPNIINDEDPDRLIGYCIYDQHSDEGFIETWWSRALFVPVESASLTL